MKPVSVLIGGAAGDGVMQTGRMLGLALSRAGFHVFITTEYPSLIRGGHNTAHIRFSTREVWAHSSKIDILIALNEETIKLHRNEIKNGGFVIHDEALGIADEKLLSGIKTIQIPMKKTVRELGAPMVVRNSVSLGALFKLLGLDLKYLIRVIEDTFTGKSDVIEMNIKAAQIGYGSFDTDESFGLIKYVSEKRKILLTGNESVGLGAIKSGLKFFVAYPITPASSLLHFLARHQYEKDLVVLQVESEVAAINMVMGASYAGVRSMTATSGTGFGLMVEGFGAIAMTECPVVLALVMRPGPGSGMPTFTTQADLRFILHASHGEFARIVIAPGDVEEAFYLTGLAFNLADKYRLPVVLLYDKFLGESYKTVDELVEEKIVINRGRIIGGKSEGIDVFLNYKLDEEPPYPRLLPGTKGYVVHANITEHDETGWSKIIPSVREKMALRRIRKEELIRKEKLEWVKFYGDAKADTLIVSWGSTKGPILEAMKLLSEKNINVGFLQVVFLSPFPKEHIKTFLEKTSKTILIENNYTGQLGQLLEEHLHYTVHHRLLRDNGLPYTPEEIAEFVEEAKLNA